MTDFRWLDPDDSLSDRELPDEEEIADDDESVDLAPCPECGEEIYEEAEQCPQCGAYILDSDRAPVRLAWWWLLLGGLGIVATIAALSIFAR